MLTGCPPAPTLSVIEKLNVSDRQDGLLCCETEFLRSLQTGHDTRGKQASQDVSSVITAPLAEQD